MYRSTSNLVQFFESCHFLLNWHLEVNKLWLLIKLPHELYRRKWECYRDNALQKDTWRRNTYVMPLWTYPFHFLLIYFVFSKLSSNNTVQICTHQYDLCKELCKAILFCCLDTNITHLYFRFVIGVEKLHTWGEQWYIRMA